ncbi:MAG: hypothetical protein K5917_03750 [Clostridiales bacterium]|nr:hypothetical protein [Clostridiales bacterium]
MKTLKKSLSLFLALTMVLTMAVGFSLSASAEDKPVTVSVSSDATGPVEAGTDVTFTIKVNSTLNIAGLLVNLNYNAEHFDFKSASFADGLSLTTGAESSNEEPIDFSSVQGLKIINSETAGKVILSVFTVESANVVTGDDIAYATVVLTAKALSNDTNSEVTVNVADGAKYTTEFVSLTAEELPDDASTTVSIAKSAPAFDWTLGDVDGNGIVNTNDKTKLANLLKAKTAFEKKRAATIGGVALDYTTGDTGTYEIDKNTHATVYFLRNGKNVVVANHVDGTSASNIPIGDVDGNGIVNTNDKTKLANLLKAKTAFEKKRAATIGGVAYDYTTGDTGLYEIDKNTHATVQFSRSGKNVVVENYVAPANP